MSVSSYFLRKQASGFGSICLNPVFQETDPPAIPISLYMAIMHKFFVVQIFLLSCEQTRNNRLFPSLWLPPLQSESKCEVFVMVIGFTLHMNEN